MGYQKYYAYKLLYYTKLYNRILEEKHMKTPKATVWKNPFVNFCC